MNRIAPLGLSLVLLAAASAGAEEWKNVPVVDSHCVARVKADPDAHERSCALQCVKGGYGLLTSDGTYLKFDAAGNEKAHAALKASTREDTLRADITGERDGDTIKVTGLKLH